MANQILTLNITKDYQGFQNNLSPIKGKCIINISFSLGRKTFAMGFNFHSIYRNQNEILISLW